MTAQTQHGAALDLNKITVALQTQSEFAGRIDLFPEIGSTNTYLAQYSDIDSVHGRVCITDFQSAGRGRRGREWVSSAQKNLTLSVAWHFDGGVQELGGLSLAVGVMLANCFYEHGIAQLALKWPNDLYLGDQKVGGILIETVSSGSTLTRAVIGVGINIGMAQVEAAKIDQPWTSLPRNKKTLDRNRLAALMIDALRNGLKRFNETGLSAFIDDWRKLHAHVGRRVTIELGGERLVGVIEDIGVDGALLLQTDNGERKRIMSGEINTGLPDAQQTGARLRLAPEQ